jgi:hypothetical protein
MVGIFVSRYFSTNRYIPFPMSTLISICTVDLFISDLIGISSAPEGICNELQTIVGFSFIIFAALLAAF